ncbi:MAG: hypothetical protein EOM19_05405 [Candidatus Moranbacteria bacterium]|nr:hypothetical protein [Candidatus Moranbacteria bacterium]
MDKLTRFKKLLKSEQNILREFGANIPYPLLRIVTGLYILQEEEILGSINRFYCCLCDHRETLVNLQRQWIFHGGEAFFWERHSRVVTYILREYEGYIFLAYLVLQSSIILEEEHRSLFEVDKKKRKRSQEESIEVHGAKFISPYFRLRYKKKFGGIVP